MRILNVGDFNWMTGRERDTANVDLFAIRSKLSNAAIRAGHQVLEFSDRAVARAATPIRVRRWGRAAANRAFLRLVDEARPDLILLNFADDLDNATLAEARRLVPGVMIVEINIDPLPDPKNRARLIGRRETVDAVFATTAGPVLQGVAPTRGFAAYMPNPVDPAIETGRAFDQADLSPDAVAGLDLIFPAGDDNPRQIGPASWRPSAALERIRTALPALRVSAPGLGSPRLRGVQYFEGLGQARIGWALSRFNDQTLYASDRMAHMLGCGLLTAVNRRCGFDLFYGPDELLFYDDLEELILELDRFSQDDGLRQATAHRGWARTWALFNVERVFAYVLDQLFQDGGARDVEWPSTRWSN